MPSLKLVRIKVLEGENFNGNIYCVHFCKMLLCNSGDVCWMNGWMDGWIFYIKIVGR